MRVLLDQRPEYFGVYELLHGTVHGHEGYCTTFPLRVTHAGRCPTFRVGVVALDAPHGRIVMFVWVICHNRSEEHTSELQSLTNLVCRLLLEKKKNMTH